MNHSGELHNDQSTETDTETRVKRRSAARLVCMPSVIGAARRCRARNSCNLSIGVHSKIAKSVDRSILEQLQEDACDAPVRHKFLRLPTLPMAQSGLCKQHACNCHWIPQMSNRVNHYDHGVFSASLEPHSTASSTTLIVRYHPRAKQYRFNARLYFSMISPIYTSS